MRFAEIPGLPETKEKLINSVKNNHLAHALLFHGPEGSATLPMALSLATYLYCDNPGETDSCGVCSPCQRMQKLILPDLNFAFPKITKSKSAEESEKEEDDKVDLLANWRVFATDHPYGNIHDYIYFNGFEKKQLNISKNSARKIIQALSLKSFEGGFKIMLIWGVEYLHSTAANALLKILEEPPEKTIFMLITSDSEKLLTTILSRTQKVMIRAFTDEELKNHLMTTAGMDDAGAEQVAILADGSMREALRLQDNTQDEQIAKIRLWFLACYQKSLKEIFAMAEAFGKADKEAQKSLLMSGIHVLREILLKNLSVDQLMRTRNDDRGFVDKISGTILKTDHIESLFEGFNQAHYHLERNGNAKLIYTDLSMDILLLMARKS